MLDGNNIYPYCPHFYFPLKGTPFPNIVIKLGGYFIDEGRAIFILDKIISEFISERRLLLKNNRNSTPLTYFILIITGGGKEVNHLRNEYRNDPNAHMRESYYHFKAIEIMDKRAATLYKNLIDFVSKRFRTKSVNDRVTVVMRTDTQISFIKCTPDKIDNYIGSVHRRDFDCNFSLGFIFFKLADFIKTYDILPHSWAVTSDAIAVFMAGFSGSRYVLFIKDIDTIFYNGIEIKGISSTALQDLMKNSGYSYNITEHLGKGTEFPIDPVTPELLLKYGVSALLINGKKNEIGFNIFSILRGLKVRVTGKHCVIYPD